MHSITFVSGSCYIWLAIQNLVSQIAEFAESNDGPVKYLIDILTIYGIIYGYTYIASLKNQKKEAIFSFWSQLVVRLKLIYDGLHYNNALINNMYSGSIRDGYEEGTPDARYIDAYKSQLTDLVEFLKTTDAQIPAYEGWSDDFDIVYRFIGHVTSFDIANPDSMFIDDFPEEYQDRKQCCEEVCSAIMRIIKHIHSEQLRYEKKLIPKYRRLILWLSRRLSRQP